MGLFSKKASTPPPSPPPPPAPLPTANDEARARENKAKAIARMQGSRATVLSGVLGDKTPPKIASTVLGSVTGAGAG